MSGSGRGPDPGKVDFLTAEAEVDIRLHLENQLEKQVEEIQQRLDRTPLFDPANLGEPMNAWEGAWMLYTEECPPRAGDPIIIRAGEDGGPAIISDDGFVAATMNQKRDDRARVLVGKFRKPARPILTWAVRTPLRLPEGWEDWPGSRRAHWLWRATDEDRLVGRSIAPPGGLASESVVLLINWQAMTVIVRREGEIEEYTMREVLSWQLWVDYGRLWVPVKEWLGW